MKANKPAIIALVLWLLFVASNAFAVFKPPYPLKAYPPDQTVVVTGGYGEDAIWHSKSAEVATRS
jgi:hypothetical protein